jgi:hypothetical protein
VRKTVWVLGAGFARSLGAPLLSDLFRQEAHGDAVSYFPEETFPGLADDMDATQIAFNWGRDVEHLWEDAEQFLAFVDEAFEGSPQKKRRLERLTGRAGRVNAQTGQHFSQATENQRVIAALQGGLQQASRRALAAETSRFMMTDRSGELWLPYRRWARGLKAGRDTVVTFNYDVLLDFLEGDAPFTIPLPHEDPESEDIPVFKLHGSANWLEDGHKWVRTADYEALARPSGAHPAIAAPGRSKSPDGKAPFPMLWSKAEKAISEAQWVIFMGYRFPPTDALARLRLGRALAMPNEYRVRRIDTVLGPDVESNDSRRLSALLRAARGDRYIAPVANWNSPPKELHIVRQPLWAEDFLTTYVDLARDQDWGEQ